LLIYDPKHEIRSHILNRESIVFSGWRTDVSVETGVESGQAVIAPSLRDLAIGRDVETLRRKIRLIELANVDGAIVFDDDQLLAAGAIIESHPNAGDQLGARTTAARSAYLWGACPVNVSSDGDVTVYFNSKGDGEECDAVIQF
jgi:DNA integrity scanning protein DisA with diadenylate cyclase activity